MPKSFIVITGKGDNDKPFACSLLHNGKVNSAEEAISLAIKKKCLFRDWIDGITIFDENKVSYDWFFFDRFSISSHYVRGVHWEE